MAKAQKLRELFKKPGLIRLVGAHNGITAKLVERNGFEGIWASSLEVSASHAVPDANILTMTDYLNAAIDMNEAVSIPVVVDVDQGYGNSTNVIRMIRKFEEAGIAAVIMEDKLFPKQNSLLADGRQEMASIAEFVGKIMAAKNAQKTDEFMVFARVEALIAGWGQDEAMKRAKAYAKAGADGVLIHSKKNDPDEITEFVDKWKDEKPLVIVPTTYPTLDEKELRNYPQVKMVIYANHVIRSSVGAVDKTLKEIAETRGIKSVTPKIVPVSDIFELQGTFEMKAAEKKFLRTGQEPINVVIPAAGISTEPSLKPLLQDTPLTMLDIDGKSILQRNVELLVSLGIKDITVIAGPNPEKINIEGVHRLENKDYGKTHILHSLMLSEKKLSGKTLLVYSDILFEKAIIENIIKKQEDIILVVDSSFKKSNVRKEKLHEEDLVLVQAEHEPIDGDRVVRKERDNPILKIGKKLGPKDTNYEYIGIALFSSKGIEDFKKAYYEEKEKYKEDKEGPFNEAKSFQMANFFDLIQKMIDKGYKVSAHEIDKGWSEVHTFDDYKRVTKMLAT